MIAMKKLRLPAIVFFCNAHFFRLSKRTNARSCTIPTRRTLPYLVIDGANNNLLENNDGGNNAAYDYELTGDTYRFGFLTPFAYDNTLYAKPGQTVKNCGVNNTVIGGVLVDTAVDVCQ